MFLNFLTNPWTIAVGAAVIAGLILRYVFGIRKSDPCNVVSQNQQGGITAGRSQLTFETEHSKLENNETFRVLRASQH